MTISVELLHDDALTLLRNLERMHILKLVLPVKTNGQPKPAKSRFAGRISPTTANQLHQQLKEMRDERR
ncbi:MAG: hypothetical protein ABIO24_13445 [Saprospiraceae bacterium]